MVTRCVRALSYLVVACSVLGASACGGESATDTSPAASSAFAYRNVTRTEPLTVGDASLPEVTEGAEGPFSFRADPGRLLFVFFGYTHCPDVCPTTLSYYKAALEALGPEQAAALSLAMATVDPERDTPEVMVEFLSFFTDDFHALRTLDREELAAAEAAFATTSRIEQLGDGKVDVVHSGTAYLVDEHGTVLVEFPFGVSAEDLAHDLELAISRLETAGAGSG